jgi:acyl carrier protein
MAGFDAARARDDIRAFIKKNFLFGGDASRLTDGGSLLEAGIMDSTGVLELIAHIEGAYGVRVGDDEMVPDNLDSVANLVSFVGRKLGAGAARS